MLLKLPRYTLLRLWTSWISRKLVRMSHNFNPPQPRNFFISYNQY